MIQPFLNRYRRQAALRGKDFRTEETVKAVEGMFLSLIGEKL